MPKKHSTEQTRQDIETYLRAIHFATAERIGSVMGMNQRMCRAHLYKMEETKAIERTSIDGLCTVWHLPGMSALVKTAIESAQVVPPLRGPRRPRRHKVEKPQEEEPVTQIVRKVGEWCAERNGAPRSVFELGEVVR